MNRRSVMDKESDFYRADGYWINGEKKFKVYIFCALDSIPENDHGIKEEDVFFFGVRKSIAEQDIGKKWIDFVLTDVYDLDE